MIRRGTMAYFHRDKIQNFRDDHSYFGEHVPLRYPREDAFYLEQLAVYYLDTVDDYDFFIREAKAVVLNAKDWRSDVVEDVERNRDSVQFYDDRVEDRKALVGPVDPFWQSQVDYYSARLRDARKQLAEIDSIIDEITRAINYARGARRSAINRYVKEHEDDFKHVRV